MQLNQQQQHWCDSSQWDFSGLRALFLNCTLKPSPQLSHTEGLVDISRTIMEKNGVTVEAMRPVDYD
ncbi:MAG: flavodoxin family protein, partial [Gammaproteobacteria bacterium]